MATCTILAYHIIDTAKAGSEAQYCCTPQLFRRQLATLQELRCPILSLAELIEDHAHGRQPPHRSVVLTFDDGTVDAIDHVLPVLQEFGAPATLFAISGLLGQGNTWASGRLPHRDIVSAAQLRELADAGISIGSHTVTHRNLRGAPLADVRNELRDSKTQLEDVLQRPVELFAYPYGGIDPTARAEAERAGYRAACSRDPGWNSTRTDRYALRRIGVGGAEGHRRFGLRVLLAFEDLSPYAVVRGTARRTLRLAGRRDNYCS